MYSIWFTYNHLFPFRTLGEGWYKFSQPGQMAARGDFNFHNFICGGIAPIYLSDDEHPKVAVGQKLSAVTCSYWDLGGGDNFDCHTSLTFNITRCKDNELVYWLPAGDGGCGRFCSVEIANEGVI